MAQIMVKHWQPGGFSWTKFVWTPTCSTVVGKAVRNNFLGTGMVKSTELGMPICSQETRFILLGKRGWHQHGNKKKQILAPMWKKLMKDVDLNEPTSFLDHVYLGCTERECKPNDVIVEPYKEMFESRISAGAIRWMLDCEWMDYLLSMCGKLW